MLKLNVKKICSVFALGLFLPLSQNVFAQESFEGIDKGSLEDMDESSMQKFIDYLMEDFKGSDAVDASTKFYGEEEYVNLVLTSNPDLKIALKNCYEAKMQMAQAISYLLPSFNVSGDYARNIRRDPMANPWENDLGLGISGVWNFYNPTSAGQILLAKKAYEQSKLTEKETRLMLKIEAYKLYSTAQLAKAVTIIRKKVSSNYESISKSQLNKLKAGTIKELDFRLAYVDWKNSLFEVSSAEKNEKLALNALKKLANIPVSQNIAVGVYIPEPVKHNVDNKKSIDAVLMDRTDYQILLKQKEMVKQEKINSYTAYLPSLSGLFNYNRRWYSGDCETGKGSPDELDTLSLGIRIDLPVLEGGRRAFKNLEANSALEKYDIYLDSKVEEIKKEIENAILTGTEAWYEIENAYFMIDSAERASKLARSSVLNGVGSQLSVSQAESILGLCKINMQQAICNYKMAYYDYMYAIGEAD